MTVLSGCERRLVVGRARIGLREKFGERDVDRARHLAGRHDLGRLAHVDDDSLASVDQRLGVLGVDRLDDVGHCRKIVRAVAQAAAETTPFSSKRLFSSPAWNISRMMSAPPTNSPFT